MDSELIAVDIGGTNARFCRVRISAGDIPQLGTVRKYKVAGHRSLIDAWRAYARDEGAPLPARASIAIAGPIMPGPIKLTNSPWVVDRDELVAQLRLDALTLINDFEAMAHGVAALPRDRLDPLFGPDSGMPRQGPVTVIGPGTGLGVAILSFAASGTHVIATEGGHIGFSPLDPVEQTMFEKLRARFGRVSIERLVSGPGLTTIHALLNDMEGRPAVEKDDATLWREAIGAKEGPAHEALRCLCLAFGSVTGDLALAHGARCVVLTGDLTGRIKRLPVFREFRSRFIEKGRYRAFMERLPVYHADTPELGLFGAAVAGQAVRA